jgi:hypothetical protein
MPSRVIAFFLALVLLWSGVSTIESPLPDARPAPEQPHAMGHAGQDPAHEGSVDDHHLDDVPAQASSDPPPEPQSVFPDPMTARLLGARLAPPGAPALVALVPPFLAGPLRPPCCTALAG